MLLSGLWTMLTFHRRTVSVHWQMWTGWGVLGYVLVVSELFVSCTVLNLLYTNRLNLIRQYPEVMPDLSLSWIALQLILTSKPGYETLLPNCPLS